MPAIRYVGPHDEVSVDGLGSVKRNDTLDAPDPVAKSLLEQVDNWQPVKKSTNNND